MPPLLCSICSHSVLLSLKCICLDYNVCVWGGCSGVLLHLAPFQSRRTSQREDLNEYADAVSALNKQEYT